MKEESILNKLPALISLFGSFILCLSIIYDYSFFKVLGTSFSEMPTTLSDHLRSSLAWVPITVFSIIIATIIELFTRRMEQGMTEEEIIQSSKNPTLLRWFRKSPKYGFMLIALIPPYFAIFNKQIFPLEAWAISSVVLWLVFHNFLFSHQRVIQRTTQKFYNISRYVPIILLYVLFNGAIEAQNIKNRTSETYLFKLEKREFKTILARSFDRFYLLWNKESQKIQILSANKVVEFSPIDKPNK